MSWKDVASFGRRRTRRTVLFSIAASWLFASSAHALVMQVPKGADFLTLPAGRVLCGPVPEGWVSDDTRTRLRPGDQAAVGQMINVVLAANAEACGGPTVEESTLIVTGDHPVIDPSSVTVALDAGRLELRGEGLEGLRIGFTAGDKHGNDVCLNVSRDREHETCALNIDRSLPADPHQIELHWAPPGGRVDPDVLTYDRHGELLRPEQTRLDVARLLLSRMFPDTRMVDIAHGEGRVPLLHPEAVSGAECGGARCASNAHGLVVESVPAAAPRLTVRLRLLPRVLMAHGDVLDNVVVETLTVLRCPMTITSGEPLRGADDVNVLVRLDPACVADVQRLRWTANSEQSDVVRVESLPDGVYVLLWIGRIASERLTVVASRPEDGSVVAVASEHTAGIPPIVASLTLPGLGEIEFIPRNREAVVTVSTIPGKGELVPISTPGAYTVTRRSNGYFIRGIYASGGYAALQFAYRVPTVPEVFADTNFAVLSDPVQRPLREASIPAPIGASSITDHAIVELFCRNAEGKLMFVEPGTPVHVPFKERDSCRLVVHRDRIPLESGEQRLDVEVTVTAVGGVDRGEAHLTQRLVLRHAKDREVVWIRGAKEQFDRINIRITHVVDESLEAHDSNSHLALPSSQWTVVTETANFKFYATAAIPASLYRFSNDPQDLGTGPLSLNFGVLSRLTWLDSEGREGLLAMEAGMMGMGLATDKDRQLSLVAGLGIAIPLSNANQATQAAVNIHAWLSFTVGKRYGELVTADGDKRSVRLSPWAFVFGPSITVGSIGALL